MATRPKSGSKNGIEWRTTTTGETRWRAVVNSKLTGRQTSGWLASRQEAVAWRSKVLTDARAGTLRRPSDVTLSEAWADFIEAARKGAATSRSGTQFRPSTLRGYERAWRAIDAELGDRKLDAIRRADVQAMIDRWAKAGTEPATIRNRLDPLRTIYRRAIVRDLVAVNPTLNLEVPRVDNARDRVASRDEAAKLIAALPTAEQALWATTFYAGLRRGELRALRCEHIDLDARLIRVQRSWDDVEGDGPPKTKAAVRKVPIVPQLASYLRAHIAATGRSGADLIFGRSSTEPFIPTTARNRALSAWDAAGLTPIGLHEARHTFASLLIAAGANAKALSVVLGHTSITITFDRYGHMMEGGEAEVGQRLASYLDAP